MGSTEEDRRRRRDAVIEAVESIPPGRVATYKQVGAAVGIGPRPTGQIVAALGATVPTGAPGEFPWWRVVRADGRPAACHGGAAARLLRDEGVEFREGRGDRVDLRQARADLGGPAYTPRRAAPIREPASGLDQLPAM